MKNFFLIIIIIFIILILILIGLNPVILNKEISSNSVLNNDIIELGVTPQTNSESVLIANNNIHINSGGIYNISGILQNGTIYIDTQEEVTLNLNNVTLVNEQNSLIDNRKSPKLILNLAKNSTNILSDGSNSSAAIKSISDIYFDGNGSMIIYANKENGIDITKGNLVINNINLYIAANETAFNVIGDILINSGTILGFGNAGIQIPSELSKQNTIIFNFPIKFKENTTFSLIDNDLTSILDFINIRNFKTLTLSTPNLIPGRYELLKNTKCQKIKNGLGQDCQITNGAEVTINITNSFMVDKKWNWYGAMNNIINYNQEIMG